MGEWIAYYWVWGVTSLAYVGPMATAPANSSTSLDAIRDEVRRCGYDATLLTCDVENWMPIALWPVPLFGRTMIRYREVCPVYMEEIVVALLLR